MSELTSGQATTSAKAWASRNGVRAIRRPRTRPHQIRASAPTITTQMTTVATAIQKSRSERAVPRPMRTLSTPAATASSPAIATRGRTGSAMGPDYGPRVAP